ncbi:MAG: hypothetical protein ACYTAN_18975 [Planctomycetota bacterium]|jgi:hypothetical protein
MKRIAALVAAALWGCASDPAVYRSDDGRLFPQHELNRAGARCEGQANLETGQLVGIGVFFTPWVYDDAFTRCMRGEGFVQVEE